MYGRGRRARSGPNEERGEGKSTRPGRVPLTDLLASFRPDKGSILLPRVYYGDSASPLLHRREWQRKDALRSKQSSPTASSSIQPISLFNTFRSYGPISKVKIDIEATPTGNLVRVGTLAFSHPSSSTAAINSLRTNPFNLFDPCTLKISADASELGSRPWKEYEDEQELEDGIRESFPGVVEVRIAGFSSMQEEVVGLARFSSFGEIKSEWLGKRSLGSLGAVVVEQL